MLAQVTDVGRAFQEPQQLVHDRLHMQLLGGQQRKSGAKIKAHLIAEDAKRPRAGAILATDAVTADMIEKVEILAHAGSLADSHVRRQRPMAADSRP